MAMNGANSNLVTYVRDARVSASRPASTIIDTITLEHLEGEWTAQYLCDSFATTDEAPISSHYVIGYDGSIGQCVLEHFMANCTSDTQNNRRSVSIKVAYKENTIPDRVFQALLDLIVDICYRNTITKLIWAATSSERINRKNGCNITFYDDFENSITSDEDLVSKGAEIAAKVNNILSPVITNFKIFKITEVTLEGVVTLGISSEDVADYVYGYTLYENNIKQQEGAISSTITDSTSLTLKLNNLKPNTLYTLSVTATSDVIAAALSDISFETLQDFPGSVSNIRLELQESTLENLTSQLTFTPPTTWGIYAKHRQKRGYRVSVLLDGILLESFDNILSYQSSATSTQTASFKLAQLLTKHKITYGQNLQIGLQTWVKDENNLKILDKKIPLCSNSIYLKSNITSCSKIFLQAATNKQVILFMPEYLKQ